MLKHFFSLIALASSAFFLSCNKSENDDKNARLSVYLTDDPADYDKVNIDVQSIQVKFTADDNDQGWITLAGIKSGVYNLLDFTNGMDTLLTSAELPAGMLQQIRLVLGTNNTVVVNGQTKNLETPSAQQSGLKLKFNAELKQGIDYKLWLDFDAGKSIVTTGSNKYILKPVIRAYTQATSGAIRGIINPGASHSWIYAMKGVDTVATAAADTITGSFRINGLAAGSYDLKVDAQSGYQDKTVSAVNVTLGTVADVGTINVQ